MNLFYKSLMLMHVPNLRLLIDREFLSKKQFEEEMANLRRYCN